MIQPIMRNPLFLSQKSQTAQKEDLPVLTDLLDTLAAHREECVGMAANMIGVHKRIIAFYAGPFLMGMINPVILHRSGPYETEEGCLSLMGQCKTLRYEKIEVQFQDASLQIKIASYTGWTAQIIQHDIDHCDGILI